MEILRLVRNFFEQEHKEKEINEVFVTDIVNFYYDYDAKYEVDVLRGLLIHFAIETIVERNTTLDCEKSHKFRINDIVIRYKPDILDIRNGIFWEIKTSKRVHESQLFQMYIYKYLLEKQYGKKFKAKIILVSSQVLEVDVTENINQLGKEKFEKMFLDYIHMREKMLKLVIK